MHMTDFAIFGPIFLVPLGPSYPSSPVYIYIYIYIYTYTYTYIYIYIYINRLLNGCGCDMVFIASGCLISGTSER